MGLSEKTLKYFNNKYAALSGNEFENLVISATLMPASDSNFKCTSFSISTIQFVMGIYDINDGHGGCVEQSWKPEVPWAHHGSHT